MLAGHSVIMHEHVNESTIIRAIESKKPFLLDSLSTCSKIQRRSLDGDGASVKFNEPVEYVAQRDRRSAAANST